MSKIRKVRPILLSAPYANQDTNLEVKLHLKSGYRTCGMVEITLDNGTKGLGEGYIAVFAPKVFRELILLLRPYLIGKDVSEYHDIIKDISLVTGYWSLQGAARHAVSAIEIALFDCHAKELGIPVFKLLGENENRPLQLYGSGGDSVNPEAMLKEFEYLDNTGIGLFKIRARKHQVNKTIWCINEGQKRGIQIAVDMTQNLMMPGQSVSDVINFYQSVTEKSGSYLVFLEEVLGPDNLEDYKTLRKKVNVKIAGGEIVTTISEMNLRIKNGYYDIVQPDATVIGGIKPVIDVITFGKRMNVETVVHCWGGPVGMMANYHAAIAGGTSLVEWPLPFYLLREAMITSPWNIDKGSLTIYSDPGLGVNLTPDIESEFPFREDAIYDCIVDVPKLSDDELWT